MEEARYGVLTIAAGDKTKQIFCEMTIWWSTLRVQILPKNMPSRQWSIDSFPSFDPAVWYRV